MVFAIIKRQSCSPEGAAVGPNSITATWSAIFFCWKRGDLSSRNVVNRCRTCDGRTSISVLRCRTLFTKQIACATVANLVASDFSARSVPFFAPLIVLFIIGYSVHHVHQHPRHFHVTAVSIAYASSGKWVTEWFLSHKITEYALCWKYLKKIASEDERMC